MVQIRPFVSGGRTWCRALSTAARDPRIQLQVEILRKVQPLFEGNRLSQVMRTKQMYQRYPFEFKYKAPLTNKLEIWHKHPSLLSQEPALLDVLALENQYTETQIRTALQDVAHDLKLPLKLATQKSAFGQAEKIGDQYSSEGMLETNALIQDLENDSSSPNIGGNFLALIPRDIVLAPHRSLYHCVHTLVSFCLNSRQYFVFAARTLFQLSRPIIAYCIFGEALKMAVAVFGSPVFMVGFSLILVAEVLYFFLQCYISWVFLSLFFTTLI